MPYEIRLFGIIENNLDVIINNTAPLGELSPKSRTFSTSKTEISNPALYDNVNAVVFSCKRDGIEVELKTQARDAALSKLHDLANVFQHDVDFQLQINARYPSIANTFKFHTQIAFNGYILPGYIEWSETVDGDTHKFMMWLGDTCFKDTYDLYEIRVIPPVPNIHNFDSDIPTILQALDNYSDFDKITAIETARGDDSLTKIVPLTLRWVDPNTQAEIRVTWTLLAFGNKALEYINQIRAIRDWLVDIYGTVPVHWVEIIPELETLTIMNIIPKWDSLAIVSTGSIEYINHPMVKKSDFETVLSLRYDDPVSSDIVDNAVFASIYWKSIGFFAFADEKSTVIRTFDDVYPDYALLTVNDINLNRLSANTRNAISAIEKALRICVTDVPEDSLPAGYYYETESRLKFLVYMSGGIMHRVAVRSSYLNALTGV